MPANPAELVVTKGPRTGMKIPVDGFREIVIGRDLSATVQVVDNALSRRHFRIESVDGGLSFRVKDLLSSNGTYVNGRRIQSLDLIDGDVIVAGESAFELTVFATQSEQNASSSSFFLSDAALEPLDLGGAGASFVGTINFDAKDLVSAKKGATAEREDWASKALQTVFEVSNNINTESNVNKLFDRIAKEILKVIKCDRVVLLLHRKQQGSIEIAASAIASYSTADKASPVSRSVVKKTILEGVTILTQDTAHGEFSAMQSIVSLNIQSVMCAPLLGNNEILGAIYVDSIGTKSRFEDYDLKLLSAIGKLAGVAVERAEYADKAIEQEKLKQSLQIAHNIQKSLLPTKNPNVRGFDIAGFSTPCDETGGDYFDFYNFKNGDLGIVVGDVSGHGIGSALLMATARAFLKALALASQDPEIVLTAANDLLEADTDDEHFMTLFFGVIDPQKGTLTYSSAGHDAPIFFKPSIGKMYELESTGMPLGMMPEMDFPAKKNIKLDNGDVIVACTDGIWEAMNADDEEFGKNRLCKIIRENSALPARDMVTFILQEVRDFIGSAPVRDDLTLFVVKVMDIRSSGVITRPVKIDG
ncbi:MAG: SpoIIE family protein phosphatase [Planctomycetes bacterium]|nr:SpoIIE family protein phosphatase [Planctomycetota bacterium]